MSLELILIAFGGGVLGALIGALPAFIFTGFVGLIGIGVVCAGGPPTILNDITFGAFLGPHIAFAGGVAAAAFAANKKKLLDSGMNTTVPLNKFQDISVLIVGGIFGILGQLLNYLYATVWTLPTDTVAMTVVTSGIIARLVFGKTGLLGVRNPVKAEMAATSETKRSILPTSKTIAYDIIMALGLGLVVSYIAIITEIAPIGFCVSAASLIFVQMGFSVPTTHHVTSIAGLAGFMSGSIYIGALFAVLAAIIFEIVALNFNTNADSHIDPPAASIFICAFIIMGIF
ncbi:hypothetical protein [Vallitalea guaymasensis]|uniref:DUF7973 domain-containing protein n=1 Tax=Vallitalea guaymasensis TaxID=1185412 RepID=A0A8J8SBL9_9FIRM|nr:hypothetical protein [Vallitalea guaymasensis]QUH28481.1 hypothetical protein HYG85_05890 [Vallitalea guaymasensis]